MSEAARLLALAVQARAIAADMKDADKKRSMLTLAEGYEALAEEAARAASA